MAEQYRIIYIDEEDDKRRAFEREVDGHLEVAAVHPTENIEELLDTIFKDGFDAVVSDYKLSEKDRKITYDGIELVERVQSIRQNFPCFVLTDYDADAVSEADDVNIVYARSDLTIQSDGKRASLQQKIKAQIDHYRRNISAAEEELIGLIDKTKDRALSADEESRLIVLDTYLNDELHRGVDIPEHLKEPQYLKKIQELIDVSDKIIEQVKTSALVKK